MARKKLKIAVLYGGKSPEHEVSIESARKVIENLDRNKYLVTPKKIPRSGRYNWNSLRNYDVVVPVFHGLFGEDGTIQGFLKLLGVPFVGAGVLGSAVGMDKDVSKKLLRDARIPVVKFISCVANDVPSFSVVGKKLRLPIFVKPANTGSSVGVSKVMNAREYKRAVQGAFKYDKKILIEEGIEGREIECAVIGNGKLFVSRPGEIIPKEEFYTYKAKYDDSSGTEYVVPVKLPRKLLKRIQDLARRTYKALECEGMGRVDFFVSHKGQVYVNEINTIPGPVMFRRMFEASGLPFPKLLDKLIELAI